jgi:hypothetical protein
MTTWKVSLFNQHAMCGYTAEGKTRRAAFMAAFRKAGPAFRHHGYSGAGQGIDNMWYACFADARANMRRGQTSIHLTGWQGLAVEIRRV